MPVDSAKKSYQTRTGMLLPETGTDIGPDHHPRPTPEHHRCTCGQLREVCVRDSIRRIWRS